jgi:ribonuclease VapC
MIRVLDASAILAALKEEPGADRVADALDTGIISSVNLAEVTEGLIKFGNSPDDARAILGALGCLVIAADESLAIEAGLMRASTERAGLSLADRFCLALARRLGVPALTADRQWKLVAGDLGVTLELIR